MSYLELEERLYTSTEVAKILGVSLRSVYRYLEDNKLTAEMKTATGRHRFTKQNILDFLSPQTKSAPKAEKPVEVAQPVAAVAPVAVPVTTPVVETPVAPVAPVEVATAPTAPVAAAVEAPKATPAPGIVVEEVEEAPKAAEVVEAPKAKVEAPAKVEESKEEEVDWLAKFRAAAEKYKTESAEVKAAPVKEVAPVSALTDAPVKAEPAKEVPEEKEEAPKSKGPEHYYTSGVGGLKEIAQNIDKSAKKASLDYVFTMDAGLSLHKPIRPFAVIHSYVRTEDLPFFEKILDLKESTKDDAQLCLIVSDSATIYSDAVEMHGLKVAANAQLKKDMTAAGEADLVSDL